MNTDPPPPEYHRRASNTDLQVPISDVQRMSMEDEERPLPEGWCIIFGSWVYEMVDDRAWMHFQVDTRAHPPRSIWVHPFEDPQWQQEHRAAANARPPPGPPPKPQSQSPTSPDSKLRKDRPPEKDGGGQSSTSGSNEKRGFFGKIKDDLVGTKEERAAAKEKRAQQEREYQARMAQQQREQQARYMERRRLMAEQAASQQARYPNSPLYSNYGFQGQPVYPTPQGPYGRRRTGFGGGGVGVPLLGASHKSPKISGDYN
ncbi:hypothetical protein FRB98_007359 [Tulasnella sp. 332]|nr:hypothetical protein FRB98_007359 [Tulasnella sp. 332]